MVEIYYRFSPTSNQAPRPEWFSKELCLKSFVRSYANVLDTGLPARFVLAVDQEAQLTRDWLTIFDVLAKKFGVSIHYLQANSNNLSYRHTFDLATRNPDNDVVIFAEDDYLWKPEALTELMKAQEKLPSDYITPYDHPVRYDDNFAEPDFPHWENRIWVTNNRHYRSQESTCMTFSTRVKTLREDHALHQHFTPLNAKAPQDRELFRCLQHLGPYNSSVHPRKLLIGPMPSLATHAHLPFLAPIIDWQREAISAGGFTL